MIILMYGFIETQDDIIDVIEGCFDLSFGSFSNQ